MVTEVAFPVLRGRSFEIPVVALLLVALLLGSGALGAVSAGAGISSPSLWPGRSPVVESSRALPAVLTLPWAERAGYVPWAPTVALSAAPATDNLTVVVSLWPKDASLFSRPPTAPHLTAAQFIDRYSPSPAQYASLTEYFERAGLTVLHTWSDHLSLTIAGPANRMGAAFGTALERGLWNGHPVLFPTSAPHLSPTLAGAVSAVSGLSSGFSRFTLPFSPVAPSAPARTGAHLSLGTTTSFVYPSAVHGAYGLDALYNFSGTLHSAAGQGIALLLWGWGYAPSDISTFFTTYFPPQLPSPTWIPVPIDGAPAPSANAINDPSHAPEELTLDIEWAGSEAPGATLYPVYAPDGPASNQYSPTDPTMEDALAAAMNNLSGVSVISMSFGLPDGSDPPFQAAFTTDFDAATARGITLLGASGDDGGSALKNSSCTPTPEVQFPASSPDVLAVGGTAPVLSVSLSGVVTGVASEPAWNRSGGGFSPGYPAPGWQLTGSAGTVIGSNGRGVPDVAGPAADNFVYYAGTPGAGGGTSFATPLWAGIVAELNALRGSHFGFLTPRLYAIGTAEERGSAAPALVDVSSGSTCLWMAKAGWDLATGWGTPRGLDLYASLTSTFVDLTVASSPTSVEPGGSSTVTVTVTNVTSHLPVGNVSINLSFAASGYSGPCGGTFARIAVGTNASGIAQSRFTVPLCYPGAKVQVTALLLSGGYFGEATTEIAVNLLSGTGLLAILERFPYNVLTFGFIVGGAIALGLVLSRREKKRRMPPGVVGPPAVPPGASGAPGLTPSWVSPPPGAPPAGLPPATTPSAYGSPVPRPPVVAPPPGPSAHPASNIPRVAGTYPVRCPRCGTVVPSYVLSCPRCGLARS